MKGTARRRLERLEKRQPTDPYAHLSDEERLAALEDLFERAVAAEGIDQVRAAVERQLTPAQLDLMGDLKVVQRLRGG